MNFQKLFYVALVSLGLSSTATAAARGNPEPLIRDSNKDITLVYADGSLNPAVAKITLKMSLKQMWAGQEGVENVIAAIANATTPEDRAKAIIQKREVGEWEGVNTANFTMLRKLYRPAPPTTTREKRPKGGADMRAPEMDPMMRGRATFGSDQEEEEAMRKMKDGLRSKEARARWKMAFEKMKESRRQRGSGRQKFMMDIASMEDMTEEEMADRQARMDQAAQDIEDVKKYDPSMLDDLRGSSREEKLRTAYAMYGDMEAEDAEFEQAKAQWFADHKDDKKGNKITRMLKDLSRKFPNSVERYKKSKGFRQ